MRARKKITPFLLAPIFHAPKFRKTFAFIFPCIGYVKCPAIYQALGTDPEDGRERGGDM